MANYIFKYVKTDHRTRTYPRQVERVFHFHNYEYDNYVPPLQVTTIGFSRWADNFYFERKCSDLFAIEFITAGDAVFEQDRKRYVLKQGDVFFLRKGTSHRYAVGASGFLHKRFVQLQGGILEPLLRTLGLWECDCIYSLSIPFICGIYKEISSQFMQRGEGYSLRASAAAYRLIIELGRVLAPQYPTSVREAIEYMQSSLSTSFNAGQLQQRVGLSQTHFNRLFRKHVGMSALQYFLNKKMSFARHLLLETAMSVKQIADALGYSDPLYFSAQFKRHEGMSPKLFRQTHRGNSKTADSSNGNLDWKKE